MTQLHLEDLLGFVKETQDSQWQKYCKLYSNNLEQKFLERVASQLNKTDPNFANKEMRTFGTMGVLRHELRDRGIRFSLCPSYTKNEKRCGWHSQGKRASESEYPNPLACTRIV